MTSFAFATSVLSAAVLLLARPVDAQISRVSNEYKCSGGEYCTIFNVAGKMCSTIGQGLPPGNSFMPSLMGGSGASAPMPFACIGIPYEDLAESGGLMGCVVTCPDSCTITPDVSFPCAGSPPAPTPPAPFPSTSGAQETTPIVLASMMTGAVAAYIML